MNVMERISLLERQIMQVLCRCDMQERVLFGQPAYLPVYDVAPVAPPATGGLTTPPRPPLQPTAYSPITPVRPPSPLSTPPPLLREGSTTVSPASSLLLPCVGPPFYKQSPRTPTPLKLESTFTPVIPQRSTSTTCGVDCGNIEVKTEVKSETKSTPVSKPPCGNNQAHSPHAEYPCATCWPQLARTPHDNGDWGEYMAALAMLDVNMGLGWEAEVAESLEPEDEIFSGWPSDPSCYLKDLGCAPLSPQANNKTKVRKFFCKMLKSFWHKQKLVRIGLQKKLFYEHMLKVILFIVSHMFCKNLFGVSVKNI